MTRNVFHGPIIVSYCAALHTVWGCLLLFNESAAGATAIAVLERVFIDNEILAGVLICSAVLAVTGLHLGLPWLVVCLIPQQALLTMSAVGAGTAIMFSQYADGVVRPIPFIAADQAHVILIAVAHGIAIITASLIRNE